MLTASHFFAEEFTYTLVSQGTMRFGCVHFSSEKGRRVSWFYMGCICGCIYNRDVIQDARTCMDTGIDWNLHSAPLRSNLLFWGAWVCLFIYLFIEIVTEFKFEKKNETDPSFTTPTSPWVLHRTLVPEILSIFKSLYIHIYYPKRNTICMQPTYFLLLVVNHLWTLRIHKAMEMSLPSWVSVV